MAKTGKIKTVCELKEIEWSIDDFFTVAVNKHCCESSTFSFANSGATWLLRCYPRWSRPYKFMGVYLYRNIIEKCQVECTFGLRKCDGSVEQLVKGILKKDKEVSDADNFIEKTELKHRKSDLVPDNTFTIICTMKLMSEITHSTQNLVLDKTGTSRLASESTISKCSCCKETLDAEFILLQLHKKCVEKPIKCTDCSHVFSLQNWFHGHGCQKERTEDVESLLEDYMKVLLNGRNHNVILKVGDKELQAHHDILSARSRVFESMLSHNMTEKNSGVIDIPDCDPQAMEIFLSYVYSGKVEMLDQNNMVGLYYIAEKYEMKHLKEVCCDCIKHSLSFTNICEVIQLAMNHTDSNLLEYATEYFMNNVLDIMQTVEWQSFLKNNTTVGNELLFKAIKRLKNINT